MIITRTPLRISLVGGGTDMPEFYKRHVGAVVSFAINKYIYVMVNKKFDRKIRVSYSKTENVETLDELQHDLARESLRYFKYHDGVEIASISDIPGEGSGLGSSSAFVVGLVNALGSKTVPYILADRAFEIEANLCGHPVGKQDHFASAYGGMNLMLFRGNGVEVNTMYPTREMQEHSLLLWTGITRSAKEILKTQGENFESGKTYGIGLEMRKLAYQFHIDYLKGMSPFEMGRYLHRNWELKVRLAQTSSLQIDEWYKMALENGAFGGKICGAGGGGFLFFIAPPETHGIISQKLGLRKIDFKIESEGSTVIYHG